MSDELSEYMSAYRHGETIYQEQQYPEHIRKNQ